MENSVTMGIRLTAWATFLLMCSGCTGGFQAVQSAGLVQQSSIFGSISAQGTFADGNGSHTWSAKQMTHVACSGVFQFTADASTGVVKVFADGSGNFTGLMSLAGENDKAVSGTCANGTITMNSPGQQYTGTYNGSGQVALGGSFVSYSWQSGSWSSCSLACGGGTQTRAVTCTSSNGASTTVVDNGFCSGQAAPGNQMACNPQSCTQACSVANGSGMQTWLNGGYGACQAAACDTGFTLFNNACYVTQQACAVGNGTGMQTFANGSYGSCQATACNSGYTLFNNACYVTQQACAANNGTGIQNFSNGSYGSCQATACNSGYTLFGNACYATVQSCSVANGSGTQTFLNGSYATCVAASCDSGYTLSNGACYQQGSISLGASVVSTYQGFMKYVYSFPIPVAGANFNGLSGNVSINTQGNAPSEMLFSLHYLPSGNCLPNGSQFTDYTNLFNSVPGSVGLGNIIVKNLGPGLSQVNTNFTLPEPMPMSGCVFIILDGGPSLGSGIASITMASNLTLSYTTQNPTPGPYIIGAGDEFCFGWSGGCQLSTGGQNTSFATVNQIPSSGTILSLYGDVSSGALSSPRGAWSMTHEFYVDPGCSSMRPGQYGPGNFFSQIPANAISLYSLTLQGVANVLQQAVYQPLSVAVNAGDCLVHLVQVNGTGGVDAETQIVAQIRPNN